jgi:hypothetical protein
LFEDLAASAERTQDRSSKQPEQQRESETCQEADGQRMHGKLGRTFAVAGAERTADRRRDATAHRAGRQHLHQHDKRKDQGDGGQLGGAQDAHVDGLEDRDQRGDEHGRQIRRRQAQQCGQDWRREKRIADLRCLRAGDDLVHAAFFLCSGAMVVGCRMPFSTDRVQPSR